MRRVVVERRRRDRPLLATCGESTVTREHEEGIVDGVGGEASTHARKRRNHSATVYECLMRARGVSHVGMLRILKPKFETITRVRERHG